MIFRIQSKHMSVKITIKGNNETNEFKDALALKEIFENEFNNKDVNGEILIICNATLFGQETKDVDLIALGSFDKYSVRVKSKARNNITDEEIKDFIEKNQSLKFSKYEDARCFLEEQKTRTVFVNDFCFVIETKRHRAEDIQLNGVNLLVRYNNKLSDATTQSENQKYSLASFFKDRLNFSPYICNFIWLRNVNWHSVKDLLGPNENLYDKHNYLPNTFSVPFLFQLACIQLSPFSPKSNGELKGYSVFNSLRKNQEYNLKEIDSIFDLFKKVKDGVGDLTRKKIEKITSQILSDQKYANAIGEKLVIISGRAGTGKTIKLLSIACDLAIQKGARSLILTYNHALVSDIKRTLALAEIPDGVDDYTVNISTLHKFFYEILVGFDIGTKSNSEGKKTIPKFLESYENLLQELLEYLKEELIGEKEISQLMQSRHDQVGWNYLLVDEAQDWKDIEKELIFRIFGRNKVIIADGVDQLVRSQNKCNWTRALKPDIDFRKTNEKKGLRQKVNLVNFVNSVADKLDVNWELDPKEELIGGKIIISTKSYHKELHQREFEYCKKNGNSAYEMMFLVPPSMVVKSLSPIDGSSKEKIRSFADIEYFKQMGISLWDGTNSDLRTQYVVDLNQHKLLQYDSCRGLEGWTVVCLDFDQFIKYKMETFEEVETGELALESFEEKRNRFVFLWSLIPLTRAIDTLIITLKDKESVIGKVLKEVYEENPDFIQWID